MTTTTLQQDVRAGLKPALAAPPAPSDPSLSELRRLQEKHTADADALGWFDQLLEIGRQLGHPLQTRFHGVYRLWIYDAAIPVTPIIIAYRSTTGRLVRGGGWDRRTGASVSVWETLEELHVYLGPTGWDLHQVDRFGAPTFFQLGLHVCHYVKSSHPTGREPHFIVPGQWTLAAIVNHAEAADRRLTAILERQEAERQTLLADLLVGIDI